MSQTVALLALPGITFRKDSDAVSAYPDNDRKADIRRAVVRYQIVGAFGLGRRRGTVVKGGSNETH